MKKRILSLALCACMALSALVGLPARKAAVRIPGATVQCDGPATPISQ